MKTTKLNLQRLIWALALLLITVGAVKADDKDSRFDPAPIPLDTREKAPKSPNQDPFGSALFIDGNTDVALDARSMAAQELENKGAAAKLRKEIDRSIRADIASGQPVTVLIAPEHFVQLTFLREGEIVFPKRAFAGQPNLLIIDKQDNSPYVYVQASAMVEGQTTNMFVETEEEGRIQTYVLNMLVTEPRNIREQISVNLVDDRTPNIRGATPVGGPGMTPVGSVTNKGPNTTSPSPTQNAMAEKWGENEVKTYLNTMIEMAEHYAEAKRIERKSGRVIYRDVDIKGYPSGKFNYIDPVEKTAWNVHQIWFFPKYDAILLDVRTRNPNKTTSMWDFSQMRWQANNSPTTFASTAAAPESMQTLPERTNRIWYLIQGFRLDPGAEFTPVFPRQERRTGRTNTRAQETGK